MSLKLYPEQDIQNIASAIRDKNGLSDLYTVGEMAQAIEDIPSGGGSYDNFLIAMRAMSGSIFDSEASVVGYYAFYSNQNVIGAEMQNVDKIDSRAFGLCYALTSVSFPACSYIGNYAFSYCSALTTAVFPECSTIGTSAFAYCYALTSVSFPVCSYIGNYAFSQCSSLTSVSFPACSYIGNYAFSYCRALTFASFPACQTIGSFAFNNCPKLTFASFPVCSYIGSSAFAYCYALQSLYLLSTSVCSLDYSTAFLYTPIADSSYLGYYGSIYVPASLVSDYKVANKWSYYSDRITAYVE